MPTYEYKCDACGHLFEKFQSMTAAPVRKCPVCGKSKVKRLLGTVAGLIFKGSGFYITDYRSESYKSAEKSDAPASAETKADAKAKNKSDTPVSKDAAAPTTSTSAEKSAGKTAAKSDTRSSHRKSK
jgi:putative FmdB family regulatory protein